MKLLEISLYDFLYYLANPIILVVLNLEQVLDFGHGIIVLGVDDVSYCIFGAF